MSRKAERHSVSIYRKKLPSGNISLVLDISPKVFNPETGKFVRFESTGLVLKGNPKNQKERKRNKDKEHRAELIRNERYNALNKDSLLGEFEKELLVKKEKLESSFIEYFEKYARKKTNSTRSGKNHKSNIALKYLKRYERKGIRFKDIDLDWVEDFRLELLTCDSLRTKGEKLSQNSAASYYQEFRNVLRQAFNEGILSKNYPALVSAIPEEEVEIIRLTYKEVQALVDTTCKKDVLKRASLFSIFSGLRADITELTWSNIHDVNGKSSLEFRQSKTTGMQYVELFAVAIPYLGKPKNKNDLVFRGFTPSAYQNEQLQEWIKDAGIDKKITFNCFRHTFATLLLEGGVPIERVQYFMGHKNLKTTLRYAKLRDGSLDGDVQRQNAKFKEIFGG